MTPTANNASLGQRLIKNFGALLGGRAIGAVLGLLSTAVLARALSLADFGLLVMLHTLVLLARGLCNLKPFDTLIRYGVAHEATDAAHQPQAIVGLLNLTRLVDWTSALVATSLAWLAATWLGPHLGWPDNLVNLGQWYALVLIASGTGTAKGLLRLHDRYSALGLTNILAPLVRCLGFVICWNLNASLAGFALAWALGMLTEFVYLHWQGARLRRQHHPAAARTPSLRSLDRQQIATDNPGIYAFMRAMYWQSNLDLLPKRLAVLLAGGVLGPAAAGLLRVATELASLLTEPAILIRQALFPDLARLWRDSPQVFYRKLTQLCLVLFAGASTLAGLLSWFAIAALTLVAGADFAQGAPVLRWLLLAGAVDVVNGALRTGLFSNGPAGPVVWVNAGAAGLYLVALAALLPNAGIIGAGWALVAATAMSALGAIALLRYRSTLQIRA